MNGENDVGLLGIEKPPDKLAGVRVEEIAFVRAAPVHEPEVVAHSLRTARQDRVVDGAKGSVELSGLFQRLPDTHFQSCYRSGRLQCSCRAIVSLPRVRREDEQLPHNATRHYGIELQFYVPVADKWGMDEGLPRLTLVWMYEGDDVEERRKVIAALDYPGFEIVSPDRGYPVDQLADLMAIDSEVCVFWSDDGKPVGADFLRLMVRPLLGSDQASTLMHLWSGNAVAMRKAALESVQKGIFRLVGNSFLKLAIFFLEVGSESRGVRSQVVVSSTEQLVPLSGEPLGRVC